MLWPFLQRFLDLCLQLGSVHAVLFDGDQFAVDEPAHRFLQHAQLFRELVVHIHILSVLISGKAAYIYGDDALAFRAHHHGVNLDIRDPVLQGRPRIRQADDGCY